MAFDSDTARSEYENYRFSYDNGHHQWIETARRCFDFWRNQQWKGGDVAKLDLANRPHLSFNTIASLVRVMKGIQRALRNDVRFAPTHDADATAAEIQDTLWLSVQGENNLDFLESDIYQAGLITGRAYYDIRMDFDHQMQGQIKIMRPRSQDVILDPTIDSYDTETWPQLHYARWVNMLDLEHMFGKAAVKDLSYSDMPQWYGYEDKFMAQTLSQLPYYYSHIGETDKKLQRAYRLIERQYFELVRREVFIDMKTGDTSEIPTQWDRNKIADVLSRTEGLGTMHRKVKTLRDRVTCDTLLLHDEELPYKNYTIVPFFPEFIDGVARGLVEDLLDPQELFNKVTSQELHIINTTANSGIKIRVGALKNMTIEELEASGSKTGAVFELDEIANMEKIQPNQVPQGHDRLSFKADKIMRDLAGVPQSARGFAREDVAGEAIESNQAASDVNFAGPLSNLHRSKQMLALRAQSLWQEYYTETRVLMVNRGSAYRPDIKTTTVNQTTPEGEVVNDVTRGKYSTVLVPSPSRATMSEGEFKQMVELRKLGIKVPDDVMIELSGAPNSVVQRMKGDSVQDQERQQQLAEQEQADAAALNKAKIEKESGAARLNVARAEKAESEAGRDPDAAYERVETTRIASDHATEQKRIALDREKLDVQREQGDKKIAVDLTKVKHEGMRHRETLDAQKNKPAARR